MVPMTPTLSVEPAGVDTFQSCSVPGTRSSLLRTFDASAKGGSFSLLRKNSARASTSGNCSALAHADAEVADLSRLSE
jgi:hypothetical protein